MELADLQAVKRLESANELPAEFVHTDPLLDEVRNRFFCNSQGLDDSIWRWRPVPIRQWILDEPYLNLADTIRPVVLEDICEFFECPDSDPFARRYDTAVFCEGIGSGKSFKTSIIATYFTHLLLCLRCPQSYFGIDKTSKIAIINMSVSERHAKKVIFSEIMQKIQGSEWFKSRPWSREDSRMPDQNCQSELKFKNNIFIIPGSSSWRTAVGYNILVGIVDEAGSYRTTDNGDQCEDIYLALERRLGSRFGSRGAIILAGSPMFEQDFVETKIKQAEAEQDTRILARRRPLWDAKYNDWQGDFFYVHKVDRIVLEEKPEDMEDVESIPNIPFLYKAFMANVTKAYRDFGAMPSATINSFFEVPSIVLKRINRERTEDPVDKNGIIQDWFKCIAPNALHCVHIDLGLTGDACGIALGHYDGTTIEGAVKVYIDLMMRIQGTPQIPVEIAKIRDYIYALTHIGFPISYVTFDGFQSSDSLQILQRKGYMAEYLSVDRNTLPYNNLKECFNESRLNFYCISSGFADTKTASEVFVRECMQLEDIEGKKVDHPPKGSKDVADAVCGVVHTIIEKSSQYGSVEINVL